MVKVLQFSEFTPNLLYEVLKLRFKVFVLEQNSMYEELDDVDFDATHILIQKDGVIVAYMRIYLKEEGVASFGRVVVHKDYRKHGLGSEIVKNGLVYIKENMNVKRVEIEAQEYLKGFYESFGFKQTSQPYDDCGVMHINMKLDI